MSATLTIDTFGVLSVVFTGSGPDETHTLVSPDGTKWLLTASGTTGAMTVVSGASGTPETLTLLDANLNAWVVSVSNAGVLSVSSFDQTVVLAPGINAPFKINGAPAKGYYLLAFLAGTNTGATVYKNAGFVASQPTPIVLNDFGLPVNAVFILVGTAYDFQLFDPSGVLVYQWRNVIGGIPLSLSSPVEFLSAITAAFVDASTFTVVGDQRTSFKPGRRVKAVASSTLYGTVTAAVYDGTRTTVTVALDSGSFDGTLMSAAPGLLQPLSSALPNRRNVGNVGESLSGGLTLDVTKGLNLLPAGLVDYHINPAPAGWLKCDGSSYLRASYPDLFAAIGTTFGAVDGTHFTVPTLSALATSLLPCIYAKA